MIFSRCTTTVKCLINNILYKAVLVFCCLFIAGSVVNAQPVWQHPLGLPYGDVTYDEWVLINKTKKLTSRDAILRQLSSSHEKDQWSAFISSELLLLDKSEASFKESNRLAVLAAKQGNPISAAYMGVWLHRQGDVEQGKNLINKAAETGHPRALAIKAIINDAPEEERLRLLKMAQAAGDELASFAIAQYQLISSPPKERSINYYSQLRGVMAADSYLSASPLIRSRRNSNDAPHAIFYAAQTAFYSSKSPSRNELKEIEGMLLDVSNRVSPRDQRSFWLFQENSALRAQTFLATNIYSSGELRNPDKAEEQLIKASKMGGPIGSTYLAQVIYASKSGLKPDSKKYMSSLESAAKQGGVSEAVDLGREYLLGNHTTRAPRKVVDLLEPFKAGLAKMPDDLRIRYRLLLAEAMYELSPEDRVAAIQDLKGLWDAFEDPEAASLLARFSAIDRSNPQADILTDMWFGRAYAAYLKKNRKSSASALAITAAGNALDRQDFSAYGSWRDKALANDSTQATKDIFASGDFFSSLNVANAQNLPDVVNNLKEASDRGSSLADVALGFIKFSFKEDAVASLSLEPYDVYFEKAVKRDGKIISLPLTAFLMQSLGANQQDELISWLKKTKNYHGIEEEGVLNFLLFNSSKSGQKEKAEALKEITRIAKEGGGFAAGFIATKKHSKDPSFLSINLDEITLLVQSINSRLPYPDSFNQLADRLLFGDGVEKNAESAKYLLKRGAEMGSKSAMMSIARGSMDHTFGYIDFDVALKFAKLADAYGHSEANDLVSQIERRIERAESDRIAAQKQASTNQAVYADSQRQGSSFFSGLGSFLGTMLEIGLVVGLIVLAGAAAGPALSGLAAAPPSVPSYYVPPARVTYQAPAPRPVPAVRSVGLPDYSSGRALYTPTPTPLPSNYTQRSAIPATIEIKDRSSFDPATKLRGSVSPDGSFTATNLVGGAVRGSISQTPTGKVQLEIRAKNDWDPAKKLRGTLEPGGDVTLRNPITGQTIKGRYDWGSEYGAR